MAEEKAIGADRCYPHREKRPKWAVLLLALIENT